MSAATDPRAIAQEMQAAQDAVRQIEPFTARAGGFDAAAAYQVSRLLHETRVAGGASPVGGKIGFTNPDMWAQYGVGEPVWAYVYDRTVEHLPGSIGRCRLTAFAEPKIEPEIVLHFHAAPPPGADAAAMLDCIDWVAHGFELVQAHFHGWKFRAPDVIADCALHGRLFVGEARPLSRLGANVAAALEDFTIALSCDGVVRERGLGSNVLGSPLKAVAHLAAVLARQPQAAPLQAGELVTTGTLTAALPIDAGQTWTTSLQGIDLPGLSLTLDA
jgi:2-keto-4-pentenoate hydratase